MDRKWLVTIAVDQVPAATAALRQLGCRVSSDAAVPVEGDTVVPVSGPDTLEPQVARVPGVKAVHRDSDLTLY